MMSVGLGSEELGWKRLVIEMSAAGDMWSMDVVGLGEATMWKAKIEVEVEFKRELKVDNSHLFWMILI